MLWLSDGADGGLDEADMGVGDKSAPAVGTDRFGSLLESLILTVDTKDNRLILCLYSLCEK